MNSIKCTAFHYKFFIFSFILFHFFCSPIETFISDMKTGNWILFTCYGILLLLFAIISSGQTAPRNRTETEAPNDTASADIFGTPRIAKRRCTMGKRWADGKCRTFVDWFRLNVCTLYYEDECLLHGNDHSLILNYLILIFFL